MKIKEVKPLLANRFLFVQITTDEGIVGVGESGAWASQDAARETVNTFALYLEGKDPLIIEHHWQYMYRSFHFRGAAIVGLSPPLILHCGILPANITDVLFISCLEEK